MNTLANTNSPDPSKAIISLTELPEGTVHPVLGPMTHKIKCPPGSLVKDDRRHKWYEELTEEESSAAFLEWSKEGKPTEEVAARYFCTHTSISSLYIHFVLFKNPLIRK